MAEEDDKVLPRRFYEAIWNQGDLAQMAVVLAPGFVDHDPMADATDRRQADPRVLVAAWRTAFPDVHLMIGDQLTDGDEVLTRRRATGTNLGPFLSWPPTSKCVTVTGMWLDRIRVAHDRELEQLGHALPSAAARLGAPAGVARADHPAPGRDCPAGDGVIPRPLCVRAIHGRQWRPNA